jgi:hypothetical protein
MRRMLTRAEDWFTRHDGIVKFKRIGHEREVFRIDDPILAEKDERCSWPAENGIRETSARHSDDNVGLTKKRDLCCHCHCLGLNNDCTEAFQTERNFLLIDDVAMPETIAEIDIGTPDEDDLAGFASRGRIEAAERGLRARR